MADRFPFDENDGDDSEVATDDRFEIEKNKEGWYSVFDTEQDDEDNEIAYFEFLDHAEVFVGALVEHMNVEEEEED